MIAHFFQTIHKLGLKTFKLTINTKKHDRQFLKKKKNLESEKKNEHIYLHK